MQSTFFIDVLCITMSAGEFNAIDNIPSSASAVSSASSLSTISIIQLLFRGPGWWIVVSSSSSEMSSTVGEHDRLGVVDVEGVESMGDRALDVFAFFECDWVLGLVADFFFFVPSWLCAKSCWLVAFILDFKLQHQVTIKIVDLIVGRH